jgi:hypothetical protein
MFVKYIRGLMNVQSVIINVRGMFDQVEAEKAGKDYWKL